MAMPAVMVCHRNMSPRCLLLKTCLDFVLLLTPNYQCNYGLVKFVQGTVLFVLHHRRKSCGKCLGDEVGTREMFIFTIFVIAIIVIIIIIYLQQERQLCFILPNTWDINIITTIITIYLMQEQHLCFRPPVMLFMIAIELSSFLLPFANVKFSCKKVVQIC